MADTIEVRFFLYGSIAFGEAFTLEDVVRAMNLATANVRSGSGAIEWSVEDELDERFQLEHPLDTMHAAGIRAMLDIEQGERGFGQIRGTGGLLEERGVVLDFRNGLTSHFHAIGVARCQSDECEQQVVEVVCWARGSALAVALVAQVLDLDEVLCTRLAVPCGSLPFTSAPAARAAWPPASPIS